MIKLRQRLVGSSQKAADYRQFGQSTYRSIAKHGRTLRGKTILHLNSTPYGGGVAELLSSQVSLERSLGIHSLWYYIDAEPKFYAATKKIHNLLQGLPGRLTYAEQDAYLDANDELAKGFAEVYAQVMPDIIVIHDPQPLPLIKDFPEKDKLILRLHIDLSKPNPTILKLLKPFLNEYRHAIVSSRNFLKALPAALRRRTRVIMPAIDPLTIKNRPMEPKIADRLIRAVGINPDAPLISQVSRFDPWKDPMGVVDAYKLAKKQVPDLQLALVGMMNAKDDPEAKEVLRRVRHRAQGDPGIFLFWDAQQLRGTLVDRFVNAVFTASDVVMQKSIREGFGLTATEAMWKGQAVIGGDAQGIHLQIMNNVNGVIVPNPLEAANAIIRLLNDAKLRKRLGRKAQASVRKNFLLPRFLLENLRAYGRIK